MFSKLLRYKDWGLLFLRCIIGIIFIYASVPKLTTTLIFSGMLHLPYLLVLVVGLVELVASLGLILGVRTQESAFVLGIVMLGAIYFKVFVWGIAFAAVNTTGWEFDLILLAALIALLSVGGGELTIARLQGDKEHWGRSH